jgi:hypothetical protein
MRRLRRIDHHPADRVADFVADAIVIVAAMFVAGVLMLVHRGALGV